MCTWHHNGTSTNLVRSPVKQNGEIHNAGNMLKPIRTNPDLASTMLADGMEPVDLSGVNNGSVDPTASGVVAGFSPAPRLAEADTTPSGSPPASLEDWSAQA